MRTEKYVAKYKETITDMNREYANLLRAFKVKDTRVEYLRTFELALDLNCDKPIWQNPRYTRVTCRWPLPKSGFTSIEKFHVYMTLYDYIMRDAGLLNRSREDDDFEGAPDRFFER